MPEMNFLIEWPDGVTETCYSPSHVVEEHLAAGAEYAVGDFLDRAGRALGEASERVRARYGFACTSALDQLERLRARADALPLAWRDGRIKVVAFEKHPPRDARRSPARSDDG
jgi:uncharacterized repeat protein (TIGR04042 family)